MGVKTTPHTWLPGVLIMIIVHTFSTDAGSLVTSTQLKIKFLGIADGKSYFAQTTPEKTWEEARDNCKSFDLELATVESDNEAQLLNKTLSAGYSYWTSAREHEPRRPSNLTWDGSETLLNPSLLPSWYWDVSEYHYCATVRAITVFGSRKRFAMDMVSCNSSASTLCQCQSSVVK